MRSRRISLYLDIFLKKVIIVSPFYAIVIALKLYEVGIENLGDYIFYFYLVTLAFLLLLVILYTASKHSLKKELRSRGKDISDIANLSRKERCKVLNELGLDKFYMKDFKRKKE